MGKLNKGAAEQSVSAFFLIWRPNIGSHVNLRLVDESNQAPVALTLLPRLTTLNMKIEFDPLKRINTISERGLDFNSAIKVFAGATYSFPDQRFNYGEPRTVTVGMLEERWVVIVWTRRGDARRIISMRYANEREIAKYSPRMG
jgi:uncharacterized DUF497 family protein